MKLPYKQHEPQSQTLGLGTARPTVYPTLNYMRSFERGVVENSNKMNIIIIINDEFVSII